MVVGLRDNFEYEGYEVITTENGSEGIKRGLHDSADLILLDVMFPQIICVELKTKRTVSLAVAAQDSRPSGSLLLSRKALSSSTSCRFIPAHKNPDSAH